MNRVSYLFALVVLVISVSHFASAQILPEVSRESNQTKADKTTSSPAIKGKATKRKARTGPTWEYKILESGPDLEAKMNLLGLDGWQLVSVNQAQLESYKLFFKRIKQNG